MIKLGILKEDCTAIANTGVDSKDVYYIDLKSGTHVVIIYEYKDYGVWSSGEDFSKTESPFPAYYFRLLDGRKASSIHVSMFEIVE